MVDSIVSVLIERDDMTQGEAEAEVAYVKEELERRLKNNESASDICEEYFGREPDYLEELIEGIS